MGGQELYSMESGKRKGGDLLFSSITNGAFTVISRCMWP